MHNFNLTDETFDVNQSNNYHLLLQSSLNGFSYAICDSVRNKCILLKHFEAKCSDWFEYQNFLLTVTGSDANLKLRYKNVQHIVNQKEFTLVPDDFIPQDEKELHRYFPGGNSSGSVIVSSASRSARAVILSPYPATLLDALKQNFEGVKLSHISLPFIHNLINESSRTLRHVFHFLIQDGFVLAGVAHSAKLDFLNSFTISTFEDLVYHMILVLEKFKISPVLAEISIHNGSEVQDIGTRLNTYIGKVRNLKASQNMVYSYIFTEDILERFANMLNLYHCE